MKEGKARHWQHEVMTSVTELGNIQYDREALKYMTNKGENKRQLGVINTRAGLRGLLGPRQGGHRSIPQSVFTQAEASKLKTKE